MPNERTVFLIRIIFAVHWKHRILLMISVLTLNVANWVCPKIYSSVAMICGTAENIVKNFPLWYTLG